MAPREPFGIKIDQEHLQLLRSLLLRVANALFTVFKQKKLANRLSRCMITTNHFEEIMASEIKNHKDIKVDLKSVGGLEKLKESLYELVILPLKWPDVLSQLLCSPKAVLLYGPPGTGKTMLANVIAKESQAVLINVSITKLLTDSDAQSQKLVGAVFSLAYKLQPAIIFIDEVDSLLGNRRDHKNFTTIKTEFIALWDKIKEDKARVLVLGATNCPSRLDEAIFRRFPRLFEVGKPNRKEREEILKIILKEEPMEQNIDLDYLARLCRGNTGDDLLELCNRAACLRRRELLDAQNTGDLDSAMKVLKQTDFEKVIATAKETMTTSYIESRKVSQSSLTTFNIETLARIFTSYLPQLGRRTQLMLENGNQNGKHKGKKASVYCEKCQPRRFKLAGFSRVKKDKCRCRLKLASV